MIDCQDSKELERKRSQQRKKWMWRQITEALMSELTSRIDIQNLVTEMERRVVQGEVTPTQAADEIVQTFLFHDNKKI
jgi:LAO/AO transport system kinase